MRNVDWQTYKTTVDAVEALSGYDLLALLRDDIENAVESGKTTAAPIAAIEWTVHVARRIGGRR